MLFYYYYNHHHHYHYGNDVCFFVLFSENLYAMNTWKTYANTCIILRFMLPLILQSEII